MSENPILQRFKSAVIEDDLDTARSCLGDESVLAELNSGLFPCQRMALLEARSTEMVDLLLDAGADLDTVSAFWSSGFWLDELPEPVGRYLLAKGATATIHGAAALGFSDLVAELLDADANLLEAKGGDGGTPLHFARTVEVAQVLVGHGAPLDPRDEDHQSTPAQWKIGRAPEISCYLLEQGAQPDVFLAAALGDLKLTRQAIAANPQCPGYRIGNNKGPFPGIGFEGRGGTILQWQIGFNLAPQEVAFKRGFLEVYELLMQHTPPNVQLQVACMLADRPLAESLLAEHPNLIDAFDDEDRQLLGKACWETNNETEAIRLMVDCGVPLGIPEDNHGYTPLHNAAWCGNADVVRLLIDAGHPIDLIDPQFNASAAGYAIHSATEARKVDDVDYPGALDALISAGLDDSLELYPIGHAALDAVLKKHLDAR